MLHAVRMMDRHTSAPPSVQNTDPRAVVQAWINRIRVAHNIEIPSIATRAKVSASTIYRWFDDEYPFNPSNTVMRKIARAFGLPMPDIEGTDADAGASASEVERVNDDVANGELKAGEKQSIWRIRTRGLEMAGYLLGDLILVDDNVQPRRGDLVVVSVNDLQGGAEAKLRIYQPPFLVTAALDRSMIEQPLFVDNERVVILGTAIKSLRVREA